MARRRRQAHELERVLGANALFATAYGNVGSSIYYALGLTAGIALGLTPLVFIISGIIFAATAATYAEGTVHYPEAGGSSSFARHAFNELVSFGAAWAQMLNYVITVAISVIFVPHYLSIFWEPLRTTPWDVIVGIVLTWLLVGLNVVGIQEAAKLNVVLAVLDFATQLMLVGLGFFLIFSPHILSTNIHFGNAPTWSSFALAIPVAMIAYTGIETVSNLAEEARDPLRSIPRAISWVAIAVFAIYFTLPWIALSAMPVVKHGAHYVTQLGENPPHGFKNDPVLGLVENLGLHGVVLSAAKIYVGILAATILFIATNAGVIGASRITYSMASYRQLPSIFRRLHQKFSTPWLSLVVFARHRADALPALRPGRLPRAHVRVRRDALVHDRARLGDRAPRAQARRGAALARAAESPHPRHRLAALRDRRRARHRHRVARRRRAGRADALRRPRLAHRRLHLLPAVSPPPRRAASDDGPRAGRDHGRGARVPQHPRAGRAGLPVDEAMDVACRLSRERGSRIVAMTVIEVPLELPLDAYLPEQVQAANEQLDEARAIGDSYGVNVVARIIRARNAGRAITDEAVRRGSEIIVMGGPRRIRLAARKARDLR